MERHAPELSTLLLRWRWALLLGAALITAAAWAPSRRVVFDRSIENMFSDSDPLLVPYRRLTRTFGSNEVVLAVYHDPQLLDANGQGIRRLRAISQELSKTPGVVEVMSLAHLSDALADVQRMQNLLRLSVANDEAIVDPDNQFAKRFRELFVGYTHGADGQTAAVICLLAHPAAGAAEASGDDPRRAAIDMLREKIQRLAGGLVAGEPVLVIDGFRFLEADGKRLNGLSTVLLSVTIALMFRSLRWIVVPLAVVQLALLLTNASLGLLQIRLSMVSSMLSAVITVVGVATVVHWIVGYRDARRAGRSPDQSFHDAYRSLAAPIFWSLVTDAVGFLALVVSQVGPIRDFGIMTSVATLFVLLSVVLLLPGLTVAGRFDRVGPAAWSERELAGVLARSTGLIHRHGKLLAGSMLVLAGVAIAGTLRLEVETDFTRNFRQGSPIVTAYNEVETHLGGAGAWEVLLPAPSSLNWDYLARVERVQSRIRALSVPARNIPALRVPARNGEPQPAGADGPGPAGAASPLTVLSFVDAVKVAYPDVGSLPVPALRDSIVTLVGAAMRSKLPRFTAALHAADPDTGQHYYRIMLRAPERQPAEQKKQLIHQIQRITRDEFPDGEVTGYFVLLTYLIDSVLRDQWLAFAIAVGGVGLLMAIVFRSLTLALVALVPNVLPILMVTGLLGWLGLRINLGAAMIAAVSMGMSIDSSIHYIVAFQRYRAAGSSVSEALESVQQHVGRAMIFSTLAIIVGFTALAFSQFVPTIYFGLLASLTMFGGLFGNLVLLPLLLRALPWRTSE